MLQQLKGHWMRKDGLALNWTWGHGAMGCFFFLVMAD